MILDFNPTNGAYFLRVPRAEHRLIMELQNEHGFDFSNTASTPSEATLFTREPYAAVTFYEHATPRAKAALLTLHTEVEASWVKESAGHIDCPPDQQLAPFQIGGVEYALRRNNTLFGDVPGLGKTPEAICFCNEVKAKRVLCIVPANIRLQWAKNIRRWSTMPWPYIVYPILHGRHGVHPTANWTVISYELARSPALNAALAKLTFDVLIIDEAHYLKEISSLRTRAVFGYASDEVDRPLSALAARAGAVIALTGTPLPNRPREAYTLARGLNFDAIDWMSEDGFRERFNPSMRQERERPDGSKYFYIDERSGRHGELQSRLRGTFMVRREKYGPNGVGYQLGMTNMPEFDIVYSEEDRAVKAALAAESLLEIDPDNLTGMDAATFGSVATVRRQMGEALAPHAAEYARMRMEGGEEKMLIFAHHHSVLDILESRLRPYGVTRIDGSIGAEKKQRLVDAWIKDPKLGIMLGNMQSMGTGTDGLQEVAKYALFAEAVWTPGVNQQGVDRLDRPGQMGKVLAEFFVARGSFSEKVLGNALVKNQTTNKALDRRVLAA